MHSNELYTVVGFIDSKSLAALSASEIPDTILNSVTQEVTK